VEHPIIVLVFFAFFIPAGTLLPTDHIPPEADWLQSLNPAQDHRSRLK